MFKPAVGIALLALLSMSAQANNGTIEVTFSTTFDLYVECLGESVSGTGYVVARTHDFETPSGTSHFIDNWTVAYEMVGISTGRQWFGKGHAPGGGHAVKNGASLFWTEKGKVDPVPVYGIADGPSWRFNVTVQMRWDEDGNLVKDFFNLATGDFHCLGRN